MTLPTTPGLYQAAAFPLAQGCHAYLLTEGGQWFVVDAKYGVLSIWDPAHLDFYGPMTPLVPAATLEEATA